MLRSLSRTTSGTAGGGLRTSSPFSFLAPPFSPQFLSSDRPFLTRALGYPSILASAFSTTISTTSPLRHYSTIRSKRVQSLANELGPSTQVDLTQIMHDLRDLELLDKLKGSSAKSGNGYKDAARALWPIWHELDEGKRVQVPFGELQEVLPPIYSIAWSIIRERLVTERVTRLHELNRDEKAALLFLQVHGIGVKYAEKYVEMGCKSLSSLERKAPLTRAQKIGLRHIEDINRLIPRSEMDELKVALFKCLEDLDFGFKFEILGSYRRGAAFCSDIDLCIRHDSFDDSNDEELSKPLIQKIVSTLEEKRLIKKEDHFTLGPKKCSTMIKLPKHKHFRRIDIKLVPTSSYDYMLLGSTGDALLMKLLRHTAKQKGWTLNEYGCGTSFAKEDLNPNGFKPNTLKVVDSEEEIFEMLGLPYLKPEERDFSVWEKIYKDAGEVSSLRCQSQLTEKESPPKRRSGCV